MRAFLILSLIPILYGCKTSPDSQLKDLRISGSGDMQEWVEFSKDHVLREQKSAQEPMIVIFECEGEADLVCSKQSSQFQPVTRRAFEAHLKNALGVESYLALEEEQRKQSAKIAEHRKEIDLARAVQTWTEFGTDGHKKAADIMTSNQAKIDELEVEFKKLEQKIANLKQQESLFNDAMACIETVGKCERGAWQNKISASDSKAVGKFLGLFVEGAKAYNRKNYFPNYFNATPKSNVSFRQAAEYCRSIGPGYQLPNAEEVMLLLQYFGTQMPKEAKIWTRQVVLGEFKTDTVYGSEFSESIMAIHPAVSGEYRQILQEKNADIELRASRFKSTFGIASQKIVTIDYYDGSGNKFVFEPGPETGVKAHAYCVTSRFKDNYQREIDNGLKLFAGQAFLDHRVYAGSSSDPANQFYRYSKTLAIRNSELEARTAIEDRCKNTRSSCSISVKHLID